MDLSSWKLCLDVSPKALHYRKSYANIANEKVSKVSPGRAMTYRGEEIFPRMKVDTFVTLVLQHTKALAEKDLLIHAAEQQNQAIVNKAESANLNQPHGMDRTNKSSFQSVICGMGESDFSESQNRDSLDHSLTTSRNQKIKDIDDSRPYLLLDVRSDDEFRMGHIITGFHYPCHWLARATNFESLEMLAFKNRPGKLLILYDNNEKVAPNVASTLVQRGYNNVQLLSGGLKTAYQKYPRGLITGSIPQEYMEPKESDKKVKKRPTARSASLPPSKCAAELTDFDDLETLRQQLQYNLLPKASRSRLVKNTSTAKVRNDTIRKEQKHQTRQVPWH